MCEPTTLAMAGLSAMSSVSQINAQNKQAAQNAANAKQAANDSYASTTQGFIEQNRSLLQGGFDAILEGRANESVAYASAVENGVQGASVKAALRAARQKTNRNQVRTSQEMESLRTQTGANLKHIRSTTQGRINSVPTTSFGLGDVAGIIAPIVKQQME